MKSVRKIHQRLAKEYSKELSKHRHIIGIVHLDKNFVDKDDDIDMVVFTNIDKNVRLPKGEHISKGFDFDLSVLYYPYVKKIKWVQEAKSAFKNVTILYDTNDKIKNILKNKLIFTGKEQRDTIIANIFRLIWCGIYDNHRWKDYKIPYYSYDVWVKRGDLLTAHLLIDYALGMLLNILYAYNKEFIPNERWKLHGSYKLKWLPKNFKKRIKEVIATGRISKDDFHKRYKIFRSLLEETIDKIEKEKILPKNMYHYYLKSGFDYSLYSPMG